ncbi:8034_t:CDS:2, partial [Gigaspora rosea]
DNITAVHLITDLWIAKSRDGYLGVTSTWLSAKFEFREALLICNHLLYPYTSKIISNELSKIIEDWDLSSKVFVVATNNGINILKATDLLSDKYNNQIKHQSCAAHTLQLLLASFFSFTKTRAKTLCNATKNSQQGHQSPENEYTNPLDVLTDAVLSDISLITTFLDPCFKDFEWCNDKDNNLLSSDNNSNNDIFKALENDNKRFMNRTEKEDE